MNVLESAAGATVDTRACDSRAGDSDAEAMAKGRNGDWEAFGHLVERHRDPLVRYLARLVGDRDQGEELAQEAFVRLWLASRRYREEGRFEAYLYSIGTRLARSSERRRRVRLGALLTGRLAIFGWLGRAGGADAGEEVDAGQRLLRQEAGSQVARAVAELPVAFRAPLILAALEERPVAEIAVLLGLRPATVKTRLFRARERLRIRLGPYWKEARP